MSWPSERVMTLQQNGVLLVEDGNHGEYRPRPDEFVSDGVSFIRAADMDGGRILFETAESITDTAFERIRKGIGKPGDCLLSHKGTIGKTAFVPLNESTPFICSPQTTFWRVIDSEKLDRLYLYFYMMSFDFVGQLRKVQNETDMAGYVSLTNQREFVVPLPPPAVQKEIAEILSSLDEKIELNRKQNRTLEAIVQALFKRWFVEFEFPNENGQPYKSSGGAMQPSELGEIPAGWEVVKIGDAIEILGGGTPSTTVSEYWDDGDVTWYSPTDLTKAGTLYSQGSRKKITQVGLQNSSAKLFPAYSLMMTSRATIGVISMNRAPACTNQGFITLIPNEGFLLYQLHGWLLQHMPLIHSKSSGTTFKEISRGSFKVFDIIKTTVGSKYAELVEPIYRKVEANTLEGEALTAIRDTLLPKLMSGELRVGAR